MKKIILLAAIVGISGLAQAITPPTTSITANAPSGLVGTGSLLGEDAYSWGIQTSLQSGQTILSATLNLNNIVLVGANSSGTGFLWLDLLKNTSSLAAANAYTHPSDGDASGDYWETSAVGATYTSLGHEYFPSVGSSINTSITLNSTELAALNTYITEANGLFDIGLDPDCHYNVGGISFTYTTSSVPDVTTTALLLVMGLGAVEIFRRQSVLAKIKA